MEARVQTVGPYPLLACFALGGAKNHLFWPIMTSQTDNQEVNTKISWFTLET